MKKTKIICSIGPASNDVDILTDMAIHGMNVARINFSHGDYEEKDKFLEGKYKIEGYEFKIHAKCIELEINENLISFQYKLFLNYQLENNLSIEIIK